MAGLAGIFTNDTLDPDATQRLLYELAGQISYSTDDLMDYWLDSKLALTRVHHGGINPEPQPIANEKGTILVFMYGEVFGYDSRRQWLSGQGHQFHYANSSPEYCLHLYEQQGKSAFAELNGSFIIAVYDSDTHEFLLVNDRYSSRPLYYHYDGSRLAFGSQVRPLLRIPGLPRGLDVHSVYDFFTFQRILGSRTYFKHIQTLNPASILRIRNGVLSIERYWEISNAHQTHSQSYYVEKLTDAIKHAVSIRTGDSHRLGLLLSGGLDSRTILAAAGRGRINAAFTVGDFDNREVGTARDIATAYDCRHVFLKRDIDHYYNMLETAVDIGDGMYRFDGAHDIGLFDLMNKDADILLHGFAYDVLFKGCRMPLRPMQLFRQTYYLPRINVPQNASKMEIIEMIKQRSLLDTSCGLFKDDAKRIIDCANQSIESELDYSPVVPETRATGWLNHFFMFDSAFKFPGYLYVLQDRAYMEERAVAFDNDLLETAFMTPLHYKVNGKLVRSALIKMSLELAMIPNANTGLPASLPVWLEAAMQMGINTINKDLLKGTPPPKPYFTNGSWPNFDELIRYNPNLQNIIRDTIEDRECLDDSMFNIEEVRRMLKDHIDHQRNCHEPLLVLLTFGRWFKRYGR